MFYIIPKVSIIVAIYNTEAYLKRCIESLVNQSLKNIEIILIDDGSTDNSSEICKYYADRDDRVRYIYQNNSGPSVARNVGIDISNGEYIAFVDSDDYVENTMYEILYENAKCYNSDISICSFYRDWNDGTIEKNVLKIIDEVVNVDEIGLANYFCKYWLGLKYANFVWNKLYKRNLLIKNAVRFPEDIRFIEDRTFHYYLIPYIKIASYINTDLYHYFQRSSSASYTYGSKNNLITHYINVYYKVLAKWDKTGIDSKLKNIYPVFLCRMIQGSIYTTRQANNSLDYIAGMVNEAIKSNRTALKMLFKAVFGISVTRYREAIGLQIKEEVKMRCFALSCMLGTKSFKLWQKFYVFIYK